MGIIRKHEVRALVAASFALALVLAAAIIFSSPEVTSSSLPQTRDAVAMEGVDVTISGPAVRTPAGYEVPVNVTNHREEQVSIKDMRIIVTLTDLSRMNATCHGPDFIAPGATGSFLVMIDALEDIEIFVIDLVQGTHYLRAVMPVIAPGLALPDLPQIDNPQDVPDDPEDEAPGPEPQDPDLQVPTKAEPVLTTTLDDSLPLRSAYYDGDPPLYGEPVSGRVIVQVMQPGDVTEVVVYLRLPDLAPAQVSVSASFGEGAAVPVHLAADSGSGCFGPLIDGSSGTSSYTWSYDGASAYHNISVTVSTYVLGAHELQLYAYDAGTGVRLSEVEATSYSIYGSAGASGMFQTSITSDLGDPFVPGEVYNLTFVDSCRYDQYRGTVRSVFKCPYADSVWLVDGDGNENLLTANGLGEYTFTWTYDGTPHEVHLRVQMAPESGNYPLATGQYWLEDASTGMVMSPQGGDGVQGTTFQVRGPELPP